MGFTLDTSTISELAAAIAAEVVQAMRAVRISTVVRDDREVVHVGPLTVDLGRREAALNGRALDLKPRELELLAALARNAGRALSRAQLLDHRMVSASRRPNSLLLRRINTPSSSKRLLRATTRRWEPTNWISW